MAEIVLRDMTEGDLSTVLVIEETSFPSPWTRASFLHELRSSHSHLTVAEQQGEVVGYMCCWYVADEVHILDIAVRSESRRQGVGERLLHSALDVGQRKGAQSAHLEVRRSNLPAIALYGKFGFRQVAIRRGYYSDGEDALLMVRSFSSEEKGETNP